MSILVASDGELEARLRSLVPGRRLFFEFREGIAGAWTELRGGDECILFGYPAEAETRWFQVFEPPRRGHNVATQALERIVFARGISVVVVTGERAAASVRRGVAAHPSVRVLTPEPGEGCGGFLRRAAGKLAVEAGP